MLFSTWSFSKNVTTVLFPGLKGKLSYFQCIPFAVQDYPTSKGIPLELWQSSNTCNFGNVYSRHLFAAVEIFVIQIAIQTGRWPAIQVKIIIVFLSFVFSLS